MFFSNKKWRNYTAALALFFSVMLIFEIIPRSFSLLSQTIELIESNAKIENLGKTKRHLNNITAENKYLEKHINSIVSDFQNDQRLSDIYTLFNHAGKEMKLSLNEIKSGSKKSNGDGLLFTPFTIKLYGDYESIYNYFIHLQQSPKTFRINKFKLEKRDDLLELTADFEIYLKL